MKLKIIDGDFTICKIGDASQVNFNDRFCFLGKTDEEFSLVCQTAFTPEYTNAREDGWKAFRVDGVLDFSLTGVLAEISSVLAEESISVFAVSTYNTDYFFIKEAAFQTALSALKRQGYEILE